jgi:2-amino-4-hydroxy-6-hydroxymethyldihydropteridine diphosphokinase
VTTAYVGLGANLGDRDGTIEEALRRLDEDAEITITATSTLRETDPVGYTEQPRFLNGAARLETTLGARELLDRLLAVERSLGRERTGPRFGPRTIDLDLLLYGEEAIDEPGLTVPHPRLAERRFVLEPLVELDPALALPDGRGLAALLGTLPPEG